MPTLNYHRASKATEYGFNKINDQCLIAENIQGEMS